MSVSSLPLPKHVHPKDDYSEARRVPQCGAGNKASESILTPKSQAAARSTVTSSCCGEACPFTKSIRFDEQGTRSCRRAANVLLADVLASSRLLAPMALYMVAMGAWLASSHGRMAFPRRSSCSSSPLCSW